MWWRGTVLVGEIAQYLVKFQSDPMPPMSPLYVPLDDPFHMCKLWFINIGHFMLVNEAEYSGGLVGRRFIGRLVDNRSVNRRVSHQQICT